MSELHILNGDFALAIWEKCAFNARSLVWKETYLEGPLPAGGDLSFFRTARAEFLSHFTEVSDIGKERLYRHLQKMDEAVLNLPQTSTLMLWFDACIFDQTILMRILYLLDQKKKELPEIFLYCCSTNCLTLEDFQRGAAEKVRLTPTDLNTAAQAWLAYQQKNAGAMNLLATQGNFKNLPYMKKALLRCAEELPGADGLNRTQKQILQILSKGKRSFEEIFSGLDAFEEYPFLGDTACLRLLDDLQKRGLLEITDFLYQLPDPGNN